MHKFTIFTVLLSIITISIVVDVVVNGYSLENDYVPGAEQSEVITEITDFKDLSEAEISSEKAANNNVIEKGSKQTSEESIEVGMMIDTSEIEPIIDKNPITKELLAKVGVEKGTVRDAPNKDLYQQVIVLDENLKNSLKTVNLFDFEEYLGTIYGLHFSNETQAMQVYSDLKVKSLAITEANIKETNTFGDQSFYFNQPGKTKTAFTTVLIGSSVYGFEYPHRSHQLFKKLSKELTK